MTVEIRKPYDPPVRVGLSFEGPGRTKQAFKKECDVNVIMAKYRKDGIISHFSAVQGRYGDFIDAPDYHEAMTQIADAQAAFFMLPAAVRKRFGNDPGAFLDFAQNPDNFSEMVKMGLAREPSADPAPEGLQPAPQGGAGGEADASPANPEPVG